MTAAIALLLSACASSTSSTAPSTSAAAGSSAASGGTYNIGLVTPSAGINPLTTTQYGHDVGGGPVFGA